MLASRGGPEGFAAACAFASGDDDGPFATLGIDALAGDEAAGGRVETVGSAFLRSHATPNSAAAVATIASFVVSCTVAILTKGERPLLSGRPR